MKIALRPETEKQIEARLTGGRYPSADEVVLAGLKLLEEREREEDRNDVRKQIAVGLEQLDRGEGVEGEAVFGALLAELEQTGERP